MSTRYSKHKIPVITLLDDNASTNYINRKHLEDSDLVEVIQVFERPGDLLESMKTDAPRPCILLIDLNMVEMNAFEFLKEFVSRGYWRQYPDLQIYLLTIAMNPTEQAVAENHPMLKDIMLKPLTPNMIRSIHQEYWLSEMVDLI